jgi:hypothetical protein
MHIIGGNQQNIYKKQDFSVGFRVFPEVVRGCVSRLEFRISTQ